MDETQVIGGMAVCVQVGTAAYALRLSRLFGIERTGWALFGLFALLLMTHLMEGCGLNQSSAGEWGLVHLIVSALLLIGITHVGLLVRERFQTDHLTLFTPEQVEEHVLERTRLLAAANTTLEDELQACQRAQDQRQASEQEFIGRLSAGVAHQFNNLLTVIQGTATAHLASDDLPERIANSFSNIEVASERAAELTRDLLALGQHALVQPRMMELNALVQESTPQLHRILGERILLRCHTCAQPLPLRGDATMLERVIFKLAAYARDAMPDGGRWMLDTDLVTVDSSGADLGRELPPGPYACLRATDSGCGIAAEVLPHVFEPFGLSDLTNASALSLAAIEGLVRQHKGSIRVVSRLGQGTCFEVFLPAVADIPIQAPLEQTALPRNNNPTLLVVEDEPTVRNILRQFLGRRGYTILEAASAIDALPIWEEHRDRIDLLLTDLLMPGGMNGCELAEKLQIEKPELRVIYSSGYTAEPVALGPNAHWLAKPYNFAQLTEVLRKALS